MKIIDNKTDLLKDNLVSAIHAGDKVSIAASCFSMYAFKELADQLSQVSELRFIFTSPAILKSETARQANKAVASNIFEEMLPGSEAETKLKQTLNQKAIAREFAAWVKSDKVKFRLNRSSGMIGGFAVVQPGDKKDATAYAPLQGFTTVDLGCSEKKDLFNLVQEIDAPFSKQYLTLFDTMWRDNKSFTDVKDIILKTLASFCEEDSPEFVYYVALYELFNDFLKDISEEDYFANERVGFKNSIVWNKLFDYQRDAALAIINKLERFNGCILADSVGLGKTYTALAVIKYYESRNKSVLVLCPKKLSENWNTFRGNFLNNPLVKDRFRYDVLYHTDLGRDHGLSNGVDLSRLNWSNYDLLVIDESHNFRNGGESSKNDKLNRYQILLKHVIRSGVNTKVLMLSATPVNNRFSDLRNQLQLAYEDGDPRHLEAQLNTKNTIDGIFKRAQTAFNKWGDQEPEKRTTADLLRRLDYDFFELLDSVTIARSRKQIQTSYDMNAIGAFPTRLPPLSYSPNLTDIQGAADYDEIFESLLDLKLTIYTPSHFILQHKREKYAKQFGDLEGNKGFSQENREFGLRRLMAINLMKRLESSVYSFDLTLIRVKKQIQETIEKIDQFLSREIDVYAFDYGEFIESEQGDDEPITVGKNVKISLADMRVEDWRETLVSDQTAIEHLIRRVVTIDAAHDNKLKKLISVIDDKVHNPINGQNKKILIFTAFADTAEYLYESVSKYALKNGLNAAMITGTVDGRSTIKDLHCDFNTILSCFSPKSKERHAMNLDPVAATANIDILIGTDCISEGQNLQDCDYCINYDIHWNPVRIIQRYGRIDRIGSENQVIQLVNFWPDVSLDEYINLKQRVETRMKIVNITSTPEEQLLSDEEKVELEYRKAQLEKLKTEVIDIEDMSTGVSITDLGLNEFKLDLLDYTKNNVIRKRARAGAYAVVRATPECPAGTIFVLKNTSMRANIKTQNRLHPYYLVYVSNQGKIIRNYLSPKDTLTLMRTLCKSKKTPDQPLCMIFNKETKNGYEMGKYSAMLNSAVQSIVEVKKEADINSLFRVGGTNLGSKEKIQGTDDFELICYLVIR